MSFVKSLANLRHRQPEGRPEWLIAGLGNPGAQYAKTRHNIGFMCLNRIAQKSGVRFRSSSRDRADIAHAVLAGTELLLAQPQTYMNDSGIAVARLAKRLNLTAAHILLVYDDIDLPFETIRIRQGGSAGGHRGVASVIDCLQETEIPRIRLGIGRGSSGVKDYVLAEFSPEERRRIPALCDTVTEIVEMIVTEGVVAAMNRYNGAAASRASEGAPAS